MGPEPGVVTLRATGLVVHRGDREVLRGIDLELRRGEVVAVLGPNGAGKTTLLRALAGLVPASRGTIERTGRVAAALQSPALARRSVRANVEAAWAGGASRASAARAGRGSAHARTLLLDEPFAGLDLATRGELLYDAASALRAPEQATLVIVHDRGEAWALANRVVILLGGRVAAVGAPETIIEQPPTPAVAAFLGFSGPLREDGGERWLRPADVILEADATRRAQVVRRIPLEDGIRVELEPPEGRIVTVTRPPGPEPGDVVGVRIDGGVRFDR